jgi:DNA-binding response OmpR family regulator
MKSAKEAKMETKSVLVVDDEKNIRLTVVQSLKPLKLELETASDGEEALGRLEERKYDLVLLDLKLPGIDGIEVLKRAKRAKTGAKRFVIITAHGSIDTAVEAMKLGAVDYIQKPFSPKAIRDLVRQVLSTEDLTGEAPDEDAGTGDTADDYRALVETAKNRIKERNYQAAAGYARKAISRDPSKPEAFNILGAAAELAGDRENALKYYRTAAAMGPSFVLALKNLERITNVFGQPSEIYIDDDSPPKRSGKTKTGEIVRQIRKKERNL